MTKYVFVLLALLLPSAAFAQIPTTDGIAAAQREQNQIQTMAQLAQQLAQLKAQLDQAKQQYTSLTGSRGFGSIVYSQALRETLPPDLVNTYESSANAAFGISGSIADIMKNENNAGSVNEMKAKIEDRRRMMGYTDKAIGIKAYEGAQGRLNQIESLMGQINTTDDPKAIAELQARIAVEQSAIGNEQNKLAIMSRMQENEAALVKQQERDLSRRILSNDNQSMPGIQ
jgi:type IV secretion system protein VirB5